MLPGSMIGKALTGSYDLWLNSGLFKSGLL